MTDSSITTISIPKVLSEKIKEKMEGTGFNSVSSYVTYILRQVLSNSSIKSTRQEKEAFTEEEEQKVKERLRSLGYLD